MDELSNKYKEDVEYSEERNTLFNNLMKIHFQNNVIRYTLKNIMSIDEKSMKQRKLTRILTNLKDVNFPNQLHCGICLVNIIVCLFCVCEIKF